MDGKVHSVLLQETYKLKYFNLPAVSIENINALLIILSLWSFGMFYFFLTKVWVPKCRKYIPYRTGVCLVPYVELFI